MIESEQFLENLSTHLRNTIAGGLTLAATLNHSEVSPAHLLFALIEEKGSVGSEILTKLNIDKKYIFNLVSLSPKTTQDDKTKKIKIPELNPIAKKVLEKAMLIAYEEGHPYVGTEHLLYGIISCADKQVSSILKQAGVKKEKALEQVDIVFDSTNKFPNIDEVKDTMEQIENIAAESQQHTKDNIAKKKKKKGSALEHFASELTNKQIHKKIDPVVGRENELNRIIHILSRRTKNNPVLVGEPGVGKTAIVEGLAKRIADGDVPFNLRGKKLISLDLTLLIAGTIYRGEFESRLKQVIDEVSSNSKYILFIDELHNIIGAGSNQGTMDAANILKPALARGKLRCIGATTFEEYKKYISGDPALERRFQSVLIEEPSFEETKIILQGIKSNYEKFHNVQIGEDAILKAVELSTKFIHDNFLPDKAIDLIDEASAFVKTHAEANPFEEKIYNLNKRLKVLSDKKENAILEEKFALAAEIKNQEQDIKEQIKIIKKQKDKNIPPPSNVTAEHIAHVLSSRLNIKTEDLLKDDSEKIEKAAETMKEHIKGQDHVIEKIKHALHQANLGLRDKNKPLASFLFVGPSGVGKTHTAKMLAKSLYHTEKALIKIDMSEFSESHSISKILGSPAGYVGHQERNQFMEAIKKRPFSIILFDEFDKAHSDVQKLLLQILDEGVITDSSGKKIKLNHSIIILTSNVGADIYKNQDIGFGKNDSASLFNSEKEKNLLSKLKEVFGNALLSRINSINIFKELEPSNIEQIIEKKITELNETLRQNRNIGLTIEKDTLGVLARNNYSREFGARDIETKITEIIQELLLEALAEKKDKKDFILGFEKNKYMLH